MWEFVEAVEGLASACEAFDAPIVSGNVSLYNQTGETAVKPTPSIAVVGVVEDVSRVAGTAFARAGLEVALLGELEGPEGATLAGSVRLAAIDGRAKGRPPALDVARERAVQGACRELVRSGAVSAAHDLSEGGLCAALAEMCFGGPGWPMVGVTIGATPRARLDQMLFGEDASRVIVAYEPDKRSEVSRVAAKHGAPVRVLGVTGGKRLIIQDGKGQLLLDVSVEQVHAGWSKGFAESVGL